MYVEKGTKRISSVSPLPCGFSSEKGLNYKQSDVGMLVFLVDKTQRIQPWHKYWCIRKGSIAQPSWWDQQLPLNPPLLLPSPDSSSVPFVASLDSWIRNSKSPKLTGVVFICSLHLLRSRLVSGVLRVKALPAPALVHLLRDVDLRLLDLLMGDLHCVAIQHWDLDAAVRVTQCWAWPSINSWFLILQKK